MDERDRSRKVWRDNLQIGSRDVDLTESRRPVVKIVEFDSVAVISIVMTSKEECGDKISDRALSAEAFESLGTLNQFISNKEAASLAT